MDYVHSVVFFTSIQLPFCEYLPRITLADYIVETADGKQRTTTDQQIAISINEQHEMAVSGPTEKSLNELLDD